MSQPTPLGVQYLRNLLHQAKVAIDAGAYLPALTAVLTVPDICGALQTVNSAYGTRYKDWLTGWTTYNASEAQRLWSFRCSLLHEGSGTPDPAKSKSLDVTRILFIPPGSPITAHKVKIGDAWAIDIPTFADDIEQAVAAWWAAKASDTTVQANLVTATQFHPNGLPPYFVGIPVIG